MRIFYEEWQMLSDNSFVETNKLVDIESKSFVGTNELPVVQFKIDANFPIAAFMNIGFTHHYAIISKVKDVEQRKFYIQFAADTKAKVSGVSHVSLVFYVTPQYPLRQRDESRRLGGGGVNSAFSAHSA